MEFHVDVIFPSNAHTGVGRLEKEITIYHSLEGVCVCVRAREDKRLINELQDEFNDIIVLFKRILWLSRINLVLFVHSVITKSYTCYMPTKLI